MKITRRQLRQIIKEGIDLMNSETGELLIFEDDWEDGSADAPEAAARDILKRLNITYDVANIEREDGIETIELAPEDWALVDVELRGKRRYRKNKKEQQRLDIGRLLDKLDNWATDAGLDYSNDNPDVDMELVARDLALGAEYEFAKDEWEELIWHFDEDGDGLNMLMDIVADTIVGAAGDFYSQREANPHDGSMYGE